MGKAREFERRFILFGVAVEITRDGKLTWEDGKPIAIGALSYLAITSPIIRSLSARGVYAAGGTLIGWGAAIYFSGQALSAWIDPEEGAENFADFVWEPEKIPERWYWTVQTLLTHDWKKKKTNFDPSIKMIRQGIDEGYIDSEGELYIGPQMIAHSYIQSNLSPYVYNTILDPNKGYNWFEEVGVGIPPWERELALSFAEALGQA